MWNLPIPGIKPTSPSLPGGFLTTGPPRKSSRPKSWQPLEHRLGGDHPARKQRGQVQTADLGRVFKNLQRPEQEPRGHGRAGQQYAMLNVLSCHSLKQELLFDPYNNIHVHVCVSQSCPALCDPMDCSPPGSSVHGILQARILQWVTIPFSRGSSWPRNWTQVSCIAGGFFAIWATTEAQ